MSTATVADPATGFRIRVWLCGCPFVDHDVHDAAEASAFAAAMGRRFSSCRVTNDPYTQANLTQLHSPPGT